MMNNRLTNKQEFELNVLISSLKEKIEGKSYKMTMAEFARNISGTIGFTVTEANISTAFKTTGVRWPRSGSSTRNGGSEKSLRANRSRIIAKCLCELYEELGKEIPPQLRRCASSESLPPDSKE